MINKKYKIDELCDVSVVIPHYNNFLFLIRSIHSILSQTKKPFEIIIVDDGTENNEYKSDFLAEFDELIKAGYIIFYAVNKNKGVSSARNIGVELAKGKYIALLDSDDVWHCKKLEIQYGIMRDMDLIFSYHKYCINLSKNNNYRLFFGRVFQQINTSKISKNIFILKNPIATPTVMIRRDYFIKFNTQLRRMEDYECWVKYAYKYNIYFIDAVLAAGFKPNIGYAGLSGDIKRMHGGMICALGNLYNTKEIGILFFMGALLLEYIKYPLRYLRRKL